MRKLTICLSLAIAVAAGILLLPADKSVQAGNAALVANQQECDIIVDLNGYHGRGTEVLTPSGEWTYVCNAVLVSGDGVDKTQQDLGECTSTIGSGWGDFLQTPGGHALAHCHN